MLTTLMKSEVPAARALITALAVFFAVIALAAAGCDAGPVSEPGHQCPLPTAGQPHPVCDGTAHAAEPTQWEPTTVADGEFAGLPVVTPEAVGPLDHDIVIRIEEPGEVEFRDGAYWFPAVEIITYKRCPSTPPGPASVHVFCEEDVEPIVGGRRAVAMR